MKIGRRHHGAGREAALGPIGGHQPRHALGEVVAGTAAAAGVLLTPTLVSPLPQQQQDFRNDVLTPPSQQIEDGSNRE
jgi:hypothetical protein